MELSPTQLHSASSSLFLVCIRRIRFMVNISSDMAIINNRRITMLVLGLALSLTACCSCLRHQVAAAAAEPQPNSLDFYMYVAVQNNSNNNPAAHYTAVQSAQPSQAQPKSFGIIHTFDNPLTSAASLNSTHLGRVQGWYGDVGQDILTLFLVQTFTFSARNINGTFSLIGVDVATDAVKYAPIVGGTGDFAYARGIAKQTLLSTENVDHQTVSWFHFAVDFKY